MTDAKIYLKRIKLYDSIINEKIEEVDRLRSMLEKITPTLKSDVITGGGNQDKLADAVAKIVDLEAEINERIDYYCAIKRAVTKTLEALTNSDQYQVLMKRYVQFKTWEQIACEMNMTYRNVLYIHGKGLQAVNSILERKQKHGTED